MQKGAPSRRLAAAWTSAPRCPLAATPLAWASRSPAPRPQVFHPPPSPPPSPLPFLPPASPSSLSLSPPPPPRLRQPRGRRPQVRAGHCHGPFHGTPAAAEPCVSLPLTSSGALPASLLLGPPAWSGFFLKLTLLASGRHFLAFSHMNIWGTFTPPRGEMEAIKWRTRK